MDNHEVESVLESQVAPADREALKQLSQVVYPPELLATIHVPESKPEPEIDWPVAQWPRRFLVRDGERIIATSCFLPRRIHTAQGPLDVLALASVKTHPDVRGRGLGRAVVQAALAYVDSGVFGVSLFQTGVPDFYRKLGCRLVNNRFTNSRGADPQAVPWWENNIMIYPASYSWPQGDIDLAGPAW